MKCGVARTGGISDVFLGEGLKSTGHGRGVDAVGEKEQAGQGG